MQKISKVCKTSFYLLFHLSTLILTISVLNISLLPSLHDLRAESHGLIEVLKDPAALASLQLQVVSALLPACEQTKEILGAFHRPVHHQPQSQAISKLRILLKTLQCSFYFSV